MGRHLQKKTKSNIWMAVLCICCFLVFPLLMMYFDGEPREGFGMAEFLVLVFWPMAGVGISTFYAIAVENGKRWMLVPVITVFCLVSVNLLMPEVSFGLSFLCLIFEGAGYGMIYFWRKMDM